MHCIFLPVLIPVLPLLGLSFFSSHAYELVSLLVAFAIGFVALFSGFHKHHRSLYPFYSLTLGIFVYANRETFGSAYEPLIVGVGSALIIFAHVLNIKLCNSCKGCAEHHDNQQAEA
ncbi:MerC domain-containing protein [Catenovulum sp. SM1970]|nr:MerC domain-containing protein [Marinifaba aquimaris]